MAVAALPAVAQPLGVVLLGTAAYLIGSIPVGWIVGRLAGVDLHQVGTGKIGTSNLFHSVGFLAAALVGPLQFCQGLLPVLAAAVLRGPAWVVAGAGLCAVIGNGWPIYLQYNGGRGVASATGAVALWWWPGFAFVLVLVILGGAVRKSPLGVLFAFAGLPVVLWLTGAPGPYAITALGIVICLLLRRFEGYRLLRRSPESSADSWVSRLLYDRGPGAPSGPTQPVDSRR
jgi:glycerol-3-phosphate acyltransferase PlsY